MNSRAKGAAAEREVIGILRAAGWPQARRSSEVVDAVRRAA